MKIVNCTFGYSCKKNNEMLWFVCTSIYSCVKVYRIWINIKN